MRWKGKRGSGNIIDARRSGGRGAKRAGGVGILGIVAVMLGSWIFGVDLTPLLHILGGGGGGMVATSPGQSGPNRIDDEQEEFVAVVLRETEEVWSDAFAERGGRYREPKLVLFSGAVNSACGAANSAVGPFYCPGDEQVYLDVDFFRTLSQRLGARGEFARAYVIAHEIGHHVQNLTGVMEQSMAARRQGPERRANRISVQVELQADCYAGMWARHAQAGLELERADLESALNAAAAIGDDALQRRSQGYVVPDSFTHGSSEQRQEWFYRGYREGTMEACNTFAQG